MLELNANLWLVRADIRVITTNGTIKNNGEAVMGRGIAAQARHYYPDIPKILGQNLSAYGNVVSIVHMSRGKNDTLLVAFPVKHAWWQRADIELIERSARQLREYMDDGWGEGWPTYEPTCRCVLPRPGCGNGLLKWEDVKPVIEPIFDDDRFIVASLQSEELESSYV